MNVTDRSPSSLWAQATGKVDFANAPASGPTSMEASLGLPAEGYVASFPSVPGRAYRLNGGQQ